MEGVSTDMVMHLVLVVKVYACRVGVSWSYLSKLYQYHFKQTAICVVLSRHCTFHHLCRTQALCPATTHGQIRPFDLRGIRGRSSVDFSTIPTVL